MVERVQGRQVLLREFLGEDDEELLTSFADPEITTWNPQGRDGAGVASWAQGRNDWSGGDHVSWAVEHDGRLAGSVSLHHLDLDQLNGEVGYWVAPWARRRGVARAAVAAASGYGFGTLGLVRVHLFHSVENPASCGVASAAGFLLEGTLRQSFRYADGRHHDEHLHARLASD